VTEVSNPAREARLAAASALRRLALFLIVAVAGVWASHFTHLGEQLTASSMEEFAARLGAHGVALLLVLGIVTPLMFLPRWPIAFLAGLLYGVGWGMLLATAASTIGAWLHFMLSRSLLAPMSDRILKRLGWDRLKIPRDQQFMTLFLLRAFPLSSFVATNVLAGALRLSRGRFLAATFLGMLPSSWMYASWGKLLKKPDPHFYGVAAMSVGLIVVGAVAAGKYLAPWFRPSSGGGAE
jgi:uncharacterized membrane protein YdjX (TVP38/TMEM64 family)